MIRNMIRSLPTLTVCLAIAVLAAPAHAQTNYPWCSNFADGFGGTNCGFVSYEQCMQTVRGSGGFCNKNDMYKPEPAGTVSAHKPRKTGSRKSS
jgi:Protein of unknown function (DUF3551)